MEELGMPGRGHHMTVENIQRIIYLLATTDTTVSEIAGRMGCSKSAVGAINRRFSVRKYNGTRTRWTAGTAPGPDKNVGHPGQDLPKKQSA